MTGLLGDFRRINACWPLQELFSSDYSFSKLSQLQSRTIRESSNYLSQRRHIKKWTSNFIFRVLLVYPLWQIDKWMSFKQFRMRLTKIVKIWCQNSLKTCRIVKVYKLPSSYNIKRLVDITSDFCPDWVSLQSYTRSVRTCHFTQTKCEMSGNG